MYTEPFHFVLLIFCRWILFALRVKTAQLPDAARCGEPLPTIHEAPQERCTHSFLLTLSPWKLSWMGYPNSKANSNLDRACRQAHANPVYSEPNIRLVAPKSLSLGRLD